MSSPRAQRIPKARGHQIVNLIEIDRLRLQLFPNGIQAFDAALEAEERHFRLLHLLLDRRGYIVEKRFVGGAALFQLRGQVAIVFRVEMLEREILQLAAKTLSYGRVAIASTLAGQ